MFRIKLFRSSLTLMFVVIGCLILGCQDQGGVEANKLENAWRFSSEIDEVKKTANELKYANLIPSLDRILSADYPMLLEKDIREALNRKDNVVLLIREYRPNTTMDVTFVKKGNGDDELIYNIWDMTEKEPRTPRVKHVKNVPFERMLSIIKSNDGKFDSRMCAGTRFCMLITFDKCYWIGTSSALVGAPDSDFGNPRSSKKEFLEVNRLLHDLVKQFNQ